MPAPSADWPFHLLEAEYVRRPATRFIAVHCAATPPSLDVGVEWVRRGHLTRGFSDVGYHYVIRRDGVVQPGRPQWAVGAHVEGHNRHAVGVCLIGGVDERNRPEANYTAAQWASLRGIVHRLTLDYPGAEVLGHRDFPDVPKACPCFDARAWWEREKRLIPSA